MGSVETKVMIFAVLILGIGFFYTTIIDRQGYTGRVVSYDDSFGYEEERDYVTGPEATGGIMPYERAGLVQVQPTRPTETYGGGASDNQQFLLAVSENVDTNPLTVCTPEKLGVFYSDEIQQSCVSAMNQLNNLKARGGVAAA